jgi:hypothetical protein
MPDRRALVLVMLLALTGCGGGGGPIRAADDRPAPPPPPQEMGEAPTLPWVPADLRPFVAWGPGVGEYGCGIRFEHYEVYDAVAASHGATCRQAVRVVARLDRHEGLSTADCYRDLCSPPGTRFGAYTCSAHLVGDSAWTVTCHDGARRVTFGRAD